MRCEDALQTEVAAFLDATETDYVSADEPAREEMRRGATTLLSLLEARGGPPDPSKVVDIKEGMWFTPHHASCPVCSHQKGWSRPGPRGWRWVLVNLHRGGWTIAEMAEVLEDGTSLRQRKTNYRRALEKALQEELEWIREVFGPTVGILSKKEFLALKASGKDIEVETLRSDRDPNKPHRS